MPNKNKVPDATPSTRRRFGHFSPDLNLSGYENIIGDCRECGARLIVNRATDLRNTYPSMRIAFRCSSCQRKLRLGSDRANHPVQQFVYDAYAPLQRRQYMQVVLSVAQSLELTLVMCAFVNVLGAVKRPKRPHSTSPFSLVAAEFHAAMEKLTLDPLRNVVAGLAVRGSRPTSVAEAREAIKSFKKLRQNPPDNADVTRIADSSLREATRHLLAITDFVKLRNKVVHDAVRPTQSQAEEYLTEIPKLTKALLRGFEVVRGQLVMPPTAG